MQHAVYHDQELQNTCYINVTLSSLKTDNPEHLQTM